MTAMLAWSLRAAGIDNLLLFLGLGSASAMLFSLAKTGFGGSSGLLAIPLMIYACGGDAQAAVGVSLPILIAADYVAVFCWRGQWQAATVGRMLPGTVVGIALGWAALYALKQLGAESHRDLVNAGMKLAIGSIAIAFVILQVARALRGRAISVRPGSAQAGGIGAAAGLTSTLAHSAGPIVAIYLLSQRMPKGRYVASTALFFWVANQLKLVPYLHLKMIHGGTLAAGLLLVPAIAAGAAGGLFLHRRVGQRHFTGIVYALLALAGVDLIRKGLDGLGG